MNIVRYEPFGLLSQLQKELTHSFANFGAEWGDNLVSTTSWMPAVDVKEEEKQFIIHADIPGVKPEEIEVSLEAGVLTIKGEKKSESKTEKDGYKRVERSYGAFCRSFSLPGAVGSDVVTAKFKNGVLEIVVPKSEATKPKRITISTED